MAGYTKADYDALYSIRVSRYFGGVASGETEVRCNYHRWAMQPVLQTMWANLAPILNIASSEDVLIVGCGFGWGVEAAATATGVTNIIGIDISEYIAAEKDNTEEVELRAAVSTAGLDPDTGKGATIMAGIYDGQPRSNVIILESDMSTQNERQLIRTALGGSWPSVVVYEDLIDDTWTDQDILNARNAGNGFGGSQRLIFIYRPTPNRSVADVEAITLGAEVVTPYLEEVG